MKLFSIILSLVIYALAWWWFGWKLALIIVLVEYAFVLRLEWKFNK